MQYLITSLWVGVHRVVSVPLGGGQLGSRGGGARGQPYPATASPTVEDRLPVVMPVRDLWSGGGELSRDPSGRSTYFGEGGDDVNA